MLQTESEIILMFKIKQDTNISLVWLGNMTPRISRLQVSGNAFLQKKHYGLRVK